MRRRIYRGGKLRDLAPGALEKALLGAFRGAAPESTRFLGETTMEKLHAELRGAVR